MFTVKCVKSLLEGLLVTLQTKIIQCQLAITRDVQQFRSWQSHRVSSEPQNIINELTWPAKTIDPEELIDNRSSMRWVLTRSSLIQLFTENDRTKNTFFIVKNRRQIKRKARDFRAWDFFTDTVLPFRKICGKKFLLHVYPTRLKCRQYWVLTM